MTLAAAGMTRFDLLALALRVWQAARLDLALYLDFVFPAMLGVAMAAV